MYMQLVSLHIRPDQLEAFQSLALAAGAEWVKDPALISLALLRDATDPAHFLVLEAYHSASAAAALHGWQRAITPLLAEPSAACPYQPLFPPAEDWG